MQPQPRKPVALENAVPNSLLQTETVTTPIIIVVVDGMVAIAAEKMAMNTSLVIAKFVSAWILRMWLKKLRKVVAAHVEVHILLRMVTVTITITTAVATGTTAIVVEPTVMNTNTVTAKARPEVANVLTILSLKNNKA